MIVVLNYLTYLTHLRNSRFRWEDSEISQNAMALTANVPNRKRNIRNFPFGNRLNIKLLHQMEPMAKFCQWLKFFMLPKIGLIDSWVEIEISIVAHNLPIEKYNFDQNRC